MPTKMPFRSPGSGSRTPDALDEEGGAGAAADGTMHARCTQVAVHPAGDGMALTLANGDALGPTNAILPSAGKVRANAGSNDSAGGAKTAALVLAPSIGGDVRGWPNARSPLTVPLTGARAAHRDECEDGEQEGCSAAEASTRRAPSSAAAGVLGLPTPAAPRAGTRPPTLPVAQDPGPAGPPPTW